MFQFLLSLSYTFLISHVQSLQGKPNTSWNNLNFPRKTKFKIALMFVQTYL
jgi:hypothetical protein